MKRALWFSLVVIAGWWTYSVIRQLASTPSPENVGQILASVCVKAVLFTVVVAALLRGAGERFASLGFRLPSAHEALLVGVPLTLAVFVVTNVVVNSARGSCWARSCSGSGTCTRGRRARSRRDSPGSSSHSSTCAVAA